MMNAVTPIPLISEIFGHSSISTTGKYLSAGKEQVETAVSAISI